MAATEGGVRITPWQQIISSCTGAVVTSLMVTPFDVVKTRLQAQAAWVGRPSLDTRSTCRSNCEACRLPPARRLTSYVLFNGHMDHLCICPAPTTAARVAVAPRPVAVVAGAAGGAPATPPVRFTGTVDAFYKIKQQEGLASLWRGLPPTLVMAVPATVIYFTSYDQLRLYLGASGPWAPMLAGSIARAGAVTVISPVEMIRTKMQAHAATDYSGVARTVRAAIQAEGIGSLWRGLGATLLRDVPFSALYWSGYEALKRVRSRRAGPDAGPEPSFWTSFSSGALSGTVAAVLTTPFDVVKTRQQSQLGEVVVSSGRAPRIDGLWTIIRDIVRHQGPSGLMIGLLPRVAKVAPACAIMISTYELGKRTFRQWNAEEHVPS